MRKLILAFLLLIALGFSAYVAAQNANPPSKDIPFVIPSELDQQTPVTNSDDSMVYTLPGDKKDNPAPAPTVVKGNTPSVSDADLKAATPTPTATDDFATPSSGDIKSILTAIPTSAAVTPLVSGGL